MTAPAMMATTGMTGLTSGVRANRSTPFASSSIERVEMRQSRRRRPTAVGNPDTRLPPSTRREEKTAGALACLAASGGLQGSQILRGPMPPSPARCAGGWKASRLRRPWRGRTGDTGTTTWLTMFAWTIHPDAPRAGRSVDCHPKGKSACPVSPYLDRGHGKTMQPITYLVLYVKKKLSYPCASTCGSADPKARSAHMVRRSPLPDSMHDRHNARPS
jgi:hypothetical protein